METVGETRLATILKRTGRFSALVRLDNEDETVFLPNSGRLQELLLPGRRALLLFRPGSSRKTRYDLIMVFLGEMAVSVDARLPAALFWEALAAGRLADWKGCLPVRREIAFGKSRLDLLVKNELGYLLVEVKSVTLVREGRALFPDAPTTRGSRHLRELMKARAEGLQAAVVFVAQRPDAQSFSPNDSTDPDFGTNLREAHRAGIGVFAYNCRVAPGEVNIWQQIPVVL